MEQLKELKAQYDAGRVSKAEYDRQRIALINSMTGTKTKKAPSTTKRAPRKEPRVAGNYAEVAPRTSSVGMEKEAARFGARPARTMEKGVRLPGDPRLEHTPDFPFGEDKAEVGDAEELQAFLDRLEEHLEGVKTYHERHQQIQDSLPRGVRLGKMPKTGRNEEKPAEKVKPSMMMVYAKKNDVKMLEQLLKLGVPVDYREVDTGNTPLMVACQSGQRQAIFFLCEKGANVNAQNVYGSSPLHELIKNKRENLAIWLIKHGADIYLEDKRRYTPYDLALPWFQKDMKKVAADVDYSLRHEVREQTQTTYTLSNQEQGNKPAGVQTARGVKFFFQNDSYKTIFVEPNWTVATVLDKVAEKLGMEDQSRFLQMIDHQKGREKRLPLDANVLQAKQKWPLIVGSSGSETDKYCRFIVLPRSDAPAAIIEDYNHFIST